MARGEKNWWSEPPWWAWGAMALSLVVIAVVVPIALNRTAPEGPAPRSGPAPTSTDSTGSAPSTPAVAATSSVEDDGAARTLLVIGDADTAGIGAIAAWPALLADRLGDDVDVEVSATGDAGYVTTPASGDRTLVQLVDEAAVADADVVVVFGSRFDTAGISDQVAAAATGLDATVGGRAPDAELVVVGPAWPGDAPPAGVRNNRDVIQAAAHAAGVTFVDPLAEGWLADGGTLVGEDGVHLSEAGQQRLADRMEPVVRAALAA